MTGNRDRNGLEEAFRRRPKRSKRGAGVGRALTPRGMDMRFGHTGYKHQLSNQGRAPQAVVKVVGHLSGRGVKGSLDYITRDEDNRSKKDIGPSHDVLGEFKKDGMNLTFERADGTTGQGAAAVNEIYKEWSKDFKERKGARKERHASHLVLSAGVPIGKLSEKEKIKVAGKVLAAARETAREQLAGYDYVMALHTDSDHPHVHIIVNNYPLEKSKGKLRLNQPELFDMRMAFAEGMTKFGIEHHATFQRDRIATRTERLRRDVVLHKSKSWPLRQMEKKEEAAVYRKLSQQWSAYLRLREQVEKDRRAGVIEKTVAKAQLAAVRRAIVKPLGEAERKAVIGQAVTQLKRQVTVLDKALESNLLAPTGGESVQTLRRKRSIDYMVERVVRERDRAEKLIKLASLSPEERKRAELDVAQQVGKAREALARRRGQEQRRE